MDKMHLLRMQELEHNSILCQFLSLKKALSQQVACIVLDSKRRAQVLIQQIVMGGDRHYMMQGGCSTFEANMQLASE